MVRSTNRDNMLDQAATGGCGLSSQSTVVGREEDRPSKRLNVERWLQSGASGGKQDWLAALLVALIVLGFFAKTVFLGMPISKISRLPEWDSLFSAYWTGAGGNCDPSIVQLQVPYYFLVTRIWQAGHLPLWNPHCGFGTPLVGDIQAMVLSPLRLVFDLVPTMHGYNLVLVFEVMLAALGTFALARTLKLPRYAAIFASLTYALCPFILYYLEPIIGTSHSLFPGLFWLFARVAANPSVRRSAIAGAGCAALILSGHPESSFFGIVFSCLLMVALMLFIPARTAGVGTTLARIMRNLIVAGSVAFCLSAPVLLPFVEYLANCDTYKLGSGGSTWVPLEGIAYNLLQPGFGPASPYLGIMAAVFVPLAVILSVTGQRTALCLSLVALIALWVSARLAPLNSLLVVKPFNCLITVYCLPILLLLIAVLAAIGFEEFVERTKFGLNMRFMTVVAAVSAVAIVPLLLLFWHVPLRQGDFDMMLPHMAVSARIWAQQMALLGIIISVYLLSNRFFRFPRWVLPAAILVVSLASQALVARGSLPIQNRFNYPVVEPIPFLQKAKARIVALGDHLCKPNTACVYGFSDIRTHNPLFPARYINFLKQAGANVDLFNQVFDSAKSPLLDLASVRYVLSLNPIEGSGKSNTRESLRLKLISTAPHGIRLYERRSALPEAYLVHRSIPARSADEALVLISAPGFDASHEAVIEGTQPEIPIAKTGATTNTVSLFNGRLTVGRHIAGLPGSAGFQPAPARNPDDGKAGKMPALPGLLARQGNDMGAALLERRVGRSLPGSAGVSPAQGHARCVRSREVVIKEPHPRDIGATSKLALNTASDVARLERPNVNLVTVTFSSSLPGLLVLTDVHYPGWHARLDGRAVPILRANYLFRGVETPAGKHRLEFEYQPVSFWAGLCLAASCLTVLIVAALRGKSQSRGRYSGRALATRELD